MKYFQDFVIVMLMVASAHAAGSGPYLPSGWRPEGPAFLLPGEINESPAVPLKIAPESLAAGSDSLREYGPPKLEEVSQDITQQALPDEAAAPPFYIIRTNTHEEIDESEHHEATTEQEAEDEKLFGTTEESVDYNTESQFKGESKSIKFDSKDVNDATLKDVNSESKEEEAEQISAIKSENNSVSNEESYITKSDNIESVKETANAEDQTEVSIQIKSGRVISEESTTDDAISQTDKIELVNEAQVKSGYDVDDKKSESVEFSQVKTEEFNQEKSDETGIDEDKANANNEALAVEEDKGEKKDTGVNNIAEVLFNLEKETKDQQDQNTEAKKIADVAGTDQPIPEGFLEYGPPGFKEYGPPTLNNVVEQQPSTGNEVDNDVRRRRFSPKFKTISRKSTKRTEYSSA